MTGHEFLHPMADAFGMPAENAAMSKVLPQVGPTTTCERKAAKRLGFALTEPEFATRDSDYSGMSRHCSRSYQAAWSISARTRSIGIRSPYLRGHEQVVDGADAFGAVERTTARSGFSQIRRSPGAAGRMDKLPVARQSPMSRELARQEPGSAVPFA